MQNRENIIRTIEEFRDDISGYGVRRIALFGSYASGMHNDDSDIDLLVEFAKDKKSFDNYMALFDLLEEILHTKVDLVTPESLKHFLLDKIKETAIDVPLS
jgi:hypothetical protein